MLFIVNKNVNNGCWAKENRDMNMLIRVGSTDVAVGKTTILCLVANMLKKYGFKTTIKSDSKNIEDLMADDAKLAKSCMEKFVSVDNSCVILEEIVGNGYNK